MPPTREGYGRVYPGPVSRHNLVYPLLLLYTGCPCVGSFIVLATTVAVVSLVDTGLPRTKPRRGVGRSGRESVMAVDWFYRNAVGPPEWECEAMGFVVWVQFTNLCRVYIKPIDSRTRR